MNLKVLSKNLFERPEDEHYPDLDSVIKDAADDLEFQTELTISPKEIIFRASDEGSISPISMQVESGETLGLSHYPLSQIARECGVSTDVLGKLSVKTACQTLNELFQGEKRKTDRNILINKDRIIRAFTSTSYQRIWDIDILSRVKEILLPSGFEPTKPTINTDSSGTNIHGNTKPALFRGDRDSWYFFSSDDNSHGDLGGLYKGFLFGNSEVGARSFTGRSFLFRGMCANFIIWDVSQTDVFRKWHRGTEKNMKIFYMDFEEWMKERSSDISNEVVEGIKIAASTPYIGNGEYDEENAIKAAAKIAMLSPMIGKKRARDIVDYALLPQNASNEGDPVLSYWSVANGLTWAAKDDSRFGSTITDYGSLAGDLILAASEA